MSLAKSKFTGSEYLTATILFILTGCLLTAFHCRMNAGDSLSFAYDISIGKNMAHPHHLLFSPIVWLIFKTGNFFSADFNALDAAKIHNIFWASTGIAIAFFIGIKLFVNQFFAIFFSFIILVSLQFVIFSSTCEVYIPGMVCLIVIFYYCVADDLSQSKYGNYFFIIFLSLAILYNQPAILIVPALFIYNFLNKNRVKKNQLIILTGIFVLVIYIITFYVQENSLSPKKFIEFVFSYLIGGEKDWGTVSNFSSFGLQTLIHSQLSVIINIENNIYAPVVYWFGLFFFSALVFHLIRFYFKSEFRAVRIFLVAWIIFYELFIFWWTPGYELLIPMIFPVLLLFVWAMADLFKMFFDYLRNRMVKFLLFIATILFCSVSLATVWFKNYPVLRQFHKGPDPSKLEADWNWKNLEPNFQIIQGYGPQVGLLYFHHFTESIEVDRFLEPFYANDTLPDYLKLKPEYGCLVPNWFLNPWYETNNTSGMLQPTEWLNYFNYLFDYKKIDGTDSILMNNYQIILPEDAGQLALVKIFPQQKTFPSIQVFMQQLDSTFLTLKLDTQPVYSLMLEKQTEQKD